MIKLFNDRPPWSDRNSGHLPVYHTSTLSVFSTPISWSYFLFMSLMFQCLTGDYIWVYWIYTVCLIYRAYVYCLLYLKTKKYHIYLTFFPKSLKSIYFANSFIVKLKISLLFVLLSLFKVMLKFFIYLLGTWIFFVLSHCRYFKFY